MSGAVLVKQSDDESLRGDIQTNKDGHTRRVIYLATTTDLSADRSALNKDNISSACTEPKQMNIPHPPPTGSGIVLI